MRGIDRAAGCVVVVRPDQYVGTVLPLHARDELAGTSPIMRCAMRGRAPSARIADVGLAGA